jgi:DNA-binding NarL/FixJ family response regulator
MSGPRVFLISVNQLVCEAVNALLRREGIELLGMETDPDLALAQVCKLNPDVVLVEGNGSGKDARLMSNLAQLVYERRDLHVIRLCFNDGQLQIYHQQQRRLVDTRDLVAAILQPDESSNGHNT